MVRSPPQPSDTPCGVEGRAPDGGCRLRPSLIQARELHWTGPLIPAKMRDMEIRYCPTCRTGADASSNFCGVCGNALPAPTEVERQGAAQIRSMPTVGCRIPPGRILLMTLLSGGLYQYYWFYRTWAQYRDHTRSEVFPVWHALSLAVPIYSLFRIYAHMQAFKQLMEDAGLRNTISPRWAVVAIASSQLLGVTSIFATGGLSSETEISRSTVIVQILFLAITLAIMVWLLLHVQTNINNYWSSQSGAAAADMRIGMGELVLTAIGVMVWLLTIMTLVSPPSASEGQFNDEKSYYGQQAAGYGVQEKMVAGDYDGE